MQVEPAAGTWNSMEQIRKQSKFPSFLDSRSSHSHWNHWKIRVVWMYIDVYESFRYTFSDLWHDDLNTLLYTLLIFFPGVKPQTSYRWVCQGEGSSDLFRCGKCESRCGRPAGPHAPSLDESIPAGNNPGFILGSSKFFRIPTPSRSRKWRGPRNLHFGACVQLCQAKAELFCHVVKFVQWWPKFGRLRRLKAAEGWKSDSEQS